jgi:hypothetical protein
MYLLTQPTLRTDAEAVTNDQHADHQFWINRGPPDLAVERAQVSPKAGQIDEAVDRPKKMVRRDVPLDAEPVKQRFLRYRPLAHHRHILLNP